METRIGNSSLTGTAKESYGKWSFQQPSVEVASGFSPEFSHSKGPSIIVPSHNSINDLSSQLGSPSCPNSFYCPGWRDISTHPLSVFLNFKLT